MILTVHPSMGPFFSWSQLCFSRFSAPAHYVGESPWNCRFHPIWAVHIVKLYKTSQNSPWASLNSVGNLLQGAYAYVGQKWAALAFFFHLNLLKNSCNVFKPGEERPQLLLANVYVCDNQKKIFHFDKYEFTR